LASAKPSPNHGKRNEKKGMRIKLTAAKTELGTGMASVAVRSIRTTVATVVKKEEI
jgi:hypothetical protein